MPGDTIQTIYKLDDEFTPALRKMAEATDRFESQFKVLGSTGTKSFSQLDTGAKTSARSIATLENNLETLKAKWRNVDSGSKEFQKLSTEIEVAEKELKTLNGTAGGLSDIMGGLVAGASFAGLGAGIKKLSDLSAQYEQTKVSFTTFMGGSKQAAQEFLDQLDDFSNRTPYVNSQVYAAARAFKAFGVEQKDIMPLLQQVGDVASGTGKDFNELALIIGKAKTQGTLFAEDINQLTEAGIPIIDQFAKILGVSADQVKKLGSEGKINFQTLRVAFANMTKDGGQFFNMMQAQSETTSGKISTLVGKAQILGRKFGDIVNEGVKPATDSIIALVDSANSQIDEMSKHWDKLDESTKEIIKVVATLAGTFGGALAAVAAFRTAGQLLLPLFAQLRVGVASALGPWGLLIAGVTALSVAIYELTAAEEARLESQRKDLEQKAEQYKSIRQLEEEYKKFSEMQNMSAGEAAQYQIVQKQLVELAHQHGIEINTATMSMKAQIDLLKSLKSDAVQPLEENYRALIAQQQYITQSLQKMAGTSQESSERFQELKIQLADVNKRITEMGTALYGSSEKAKAAGDVIMGIFDPKRLLSVLSQFEKSAEAVAAVSGKFHGIDLSINYSAQDFAKVKGWLEEMAAKNVIKLKVTPQVDEKGVQTFSVDVKANTAEAVKQLEMLHKNVGANPLTEKVSLKIEPDPFQELAKMAQKYLAVAQTVMGQVNQIWNNQLEGIKRTQEKMSGTFDIFNTIAKKQTDALVASTTEMYDRQIQAIQDANQKELDAYNALQNAKIQAEQDALNQRAIMRDAELQREQQRLKEELAAKQAQIDAEYAARQADNERITQDALARAANQQDLEQARLDAQQQAVADYTDAVNTLVQDSANQQTADEKTAADSVAQIKAEQDAQNQKAQQDAADATAALEAKKAADLKAIKDKADADDKTRQKAQALFSYEMSLAAFQIQKQMNMANIVMSTAQGIIGAWSQSILQLGPILGIAVASGLTAMITGIGAQSLSLAASAPPPMPPAILFASEGGTVPGVYNGRPGTYGDTVPAMLTPGEEVLSRATKTKLDDFLNGNRPQGMAQPITIYVSVPAGTTENPDAYGQRVGAAASRELAYLLDGVR